MAEGISVHLQASSPLIQLLTKENKVDRIPYERFRKFYGNILILVHKQRSPPKKTYQIAYLQISKHIVLVNTNYVSAQVIALILSHVICQCHFVGIDSKNVTITSKEKTHLQVKLVV